MPLSMLPFSFLFLFITFFGTTLSLSSTHWLGTWVGLEVNLLGFIPLIISRGSVLEAESAIKYFLIQALGSSILMLSSTQAFSISLTWETLNPYLSKSTFLLISSLMLKLGAFPLHFWLPSVMAGLSWPLCLLMATWQKMAPLFLLLAVTQSTPNTPEINFILLMGGLSSIMGGLGGINQTQIRAIMAYSSIAHIGWMLVSLTISETLLKIYFFIYLTISVGLFLLLYLFEMPAFQNTMKKKSSESKDTQLVLILMLLSLGGLPPLLGFVSKWATLSSLSFTSTFLIAIPLITGSLMSLFYYLSLLFSLTLSSSANSITIFSQLSKNHFSPLPITAMTLFILIFNTGGMILISSIAPMMDFI